MKNNNNSSFYPQNNHNVPSQEAFKELSKTIVGKVLVRLKESGGKVGFRDILSQMAEHRRNIAKTLGVSDWDRFGREWASTTQSADSGKALTSMTTFNFQYSLYGEIILSRVMGSLSSV